MATTAHSTGTGNGGSLREILKLPLAPLRMSLHQTLSPLIASYNQMLQGQDAEHIQQARAQLDASAQGRFDAQIFTAFLDKIEDVVRQNPRNDLNAFRSEKQKILHAVATGTVATEPNTRPAANQLMWAAALGYLTANPSAQEKWADEYQCVDVTDSRIWQAVEESRFVEGELLDHAFHLAEDIGKTDTRLRWGPPGSWNYTNREEGLINLDLIAALTIGLEHARSTAYHEIGHSKLTIGVSPRVREILSILQEQDERAEREGGYEPEEFPARQALAVEMHMRGRLWNSGEDNCVNRYAVNKSTTQDHGYSRNVVNTLLNGTGHLALQVMANGGKPVEVDEEITTRHGEGSVGSTSATPRQEAALAEKKFHNLVHTVNMSFFQNNGLFNNTPEEWTLAGVRTDWITEDPAYPGATGQSPEEALQHIRSLCQEMEQAQPTRRDRMFGQKNLDLVIEKHFNRRMEIQEEIWERYIKQHAEVLMQQAEQEAKEQLEQQKEEQEQDQQEQGQGEQQPQQGGEQGEGEPQQGGEQGEGQPQQGEGQQGEGQPQQGEGQGQPQQGGEQGEGQPQQGEGQGQGDNEPQQGEQGEGQGEQQPQQGEGQGQEGEGQEGEGQEGEGQGQQGEGQQGQGQGQQSNGQGVSVKGHGQQQDRAGNRPQGHEHGQGQEGEGKEGEGEGKGEQGEGQGEQQPQQGESKEGEGQEGQGQEGEGQGQEGQGQEGEGQEGEGKEGEGEGQGQDGKPGKDGKQGRTVEELLEKRKQQQQEEAERKKAEQGEPAKPNPNNPNSIWAEGGNTHTLDDLPIGNWADYEKTVAEYAGPINQMARVLERLRDKKFDMQKEYSREHELLPEEGFSTFDPQRQLQLEIKRRSGEKLEESDFERFRRDADKPNPAPDDLVVAIDLSGSMTMGKAPNRNVDMAVQSACILLEAGKKVGMNVYVCGWGDTSGPRWLATPEMQRAKIGENIAGVKDGAHWGTMLTPAFTATKAKEGYEGVIEMMSKVNGNGDRLVGDTHMMVVSDGDLGDGNTTSLVVDRLLKSCPRMSLDIAVINKNEETQMDKMVKSVKGSVQKRLGLKHATEPQAVQDMILHSMRDRVQASVSEPAIPLEAKRQMFGQALKNIQRPGMLPSRDTETAFSR